MVVILMIQVFQKYYYLYSMRSGLVFSMKGYFYYIKRNFILMNDIELSALLVVSRDFSAAVGMVSQILHSATPRQTHQSPGGLNGCRREQNLAQRWKVKSVQLLYSFT